MMFKITERLQYNSTEERSYRSGATSKAVMTADQT